MQIYSPLSKKILAKFFSSSSNCLEPDSPVASTAQRCHDSIISLNEEGLTSRQELTFSLLQNEELTLSSLSFRVCTRLLGKVGGTTMHVICCNPYILLLTTTSQLLQFSTATARRTDHLLLLSARKKSCIYQSIFNFVVNWKQLPLQEVQNSIYHSS